MSGFNILCDRLPDSINIDGAVYPIETDFRRWILMLDLFDEFKDAADSPAGIITLARCAERIVMKEKIPSDLPANGIVRLIEGIAVFASGGKAGDEEQETDRTQTPSAPVFDPAFDGELILSSFLVHYGIDLTKVRMHWWKFLALLRALPSDSDFMKVVRLRSCDTTRIGDDEMRRRVRRAKAALRIRQKKPNKEANYG